MFERAFLKVKVTTGAPIECGDPVMRIGGIKANQLANSCILTIVAIDILKKQNVRLLRDVDAVMAKLETCLLYTSPSPRDRTRSRMPSSA